MTEKPSQKIKVSHVNRITSFIGGYGFLVEQSVKRIRAAGSDLWNLAFAYDIFKEAPTRNVTVFENGSIKIMDTHGFPPRNRMLYKNENDICISFVEYNKMGQLSREFLFNKDKKSWHCLVYISREKRQKPLDRPPIRIDITITERVGFSGEIITGQFLDYDRNLVVSWKKDHNEYFDIRNLATSRGKSKKGEIAGRGTINGAVKVTEIHHGRILYKRDENQLDEVWGLYELQPKGKPKYLFEIIDIENLKNAIRWSSEGITIYRHRGDEATLMAISEITDCYGNDTKEGALCLANFILDIMQQPAFSSIEIMIDKKNNYIFLARPKKGGIEQIGMFTPIMGEGKRPRKGSCVSVFSRAAKGKPLFYKRYIAYTGGKVYRDDISYDTETSWTGSSATYMTARRWSIQHYRDSIERDFTVARDKIKIRKEGSTSGFFTECINIAGKYSDGLLQASGAIVAGMLWAISYVDCLSAKGLIDAHLLNDAHRFRQAYRKEFLERAIANAKGSYASFVEGFTGKKSKDSDLERNIINVKHEMVGMGHPVLGGVLEGGLSFARLESIAIGAGLDKIIKLAMTYRVLRVSLLSLSVAGVADSVKNFADAGVKIYRASLTNDGRKLADSVSNLTSQTFPLLLSLYSLGKLVKSPKKRLVRRKFNEKWRNKSTSQPNKENPLGKTSTKNAVTKKAGGSPKYTLGEALGKHPKFNKTSRLKEYGKKFFTRKTELGGSGTAGQCHSENTKEIKRLAIKYKKQGYEIKLRETAPPGIQGSEIKIKDISSTGGTQKNIGKLEIRKPGSHKWITIAEAESIYLPCEKSRFGTGINQVQGHVITKIREPGKKLFIRDVTNNDCCISIFGGKSNVPIVNGSPQSMFTQRQHNKLIKEQLLLRKNEYIKNGLKVPEDLSRAISKWLSR